MRPTNINVWAEKTNTKKKGPFQDQNIGPMIKRVGGYPPNKGSDGKEKAHHWSQRCESSGSAVAGCSVDGYSLAESRATASPIEGTNP